MDKFKRVAAVQFKAVLGTVTIQPSRTLGHYLLATFPNPVRIRAFVSKQVFDLAVSRIRSPGPVGESTMEEARRAAKYLQRKHVRIRWCVDEGPDGEQYYAAYVIDIL